MFTQDSKSFLASVSIALAAFLAGTEQVRAQFTFGEPENLGPTVNTSGGEHGASISADGLTLYFGSGRPGGSGGGDLWMTTRLSATDPWQTPVNLGPTVNSADGECCPSISADGLTLFFGSGKPGGLGGGDIWMTTRASTSDPWQPPVNLGAAVNSSTWDGSPDVSADGLTLLFSSIKSGGIGFTNDLYMSTRAGVSDPWGSAVNLGPPVNVVDAEWSPSLSTDGLTLFFQSNRCGRLGGWDLYVTTRPTLSDPWGTPLNLGPQINTVFADGQPDISADGMTLFFNSDRAGGSGGLDIWQVAVTPDCAGNPNGICESGENCVNCPADCFAGSSSGCGNGVCEPFLDEDCISCPGDCNGKQKGNPNNRFCCGCGGQNQVTCDDPRCTSEGFDCSDQPADSSSCCGDGSCEDTENGFNCEVDCGPPPFFCGDTNCDPGEDPCNCPSDCGPPPASETNCADGINEDCDGATDCNDTDCAAEPACQGTWEIEIVTTPGSSGPWTSLAFDAAGNPSIGYGNFSANNRADFAYWDGSSWQIEAVTPRFSAAGINLVYDPSGTIATMTHFWNGKLALSRRIGGAWETETVGQGTSNSLAYDPAGNPTVAYVRQDDLKFARWNGSSFDIEIVEAGVVINDNDFSLAYAPSPPHGDGNPSIAYSADLGSGDHDNVKFAHWNGSSWDIEVVEAVNTPGFGAWARLAYAPPPPHGDGNPSIVHINFETGCVRFLQSVGGVWGTAEIVDCESSQAANSTLAFDSMGTPYVSYKVNGNELRVAHRDAAGWHVETVAIGSLGAKSLALDPVTGLPSLSYRDTQGSDKIMFARKVP